MRYGEARIFKMADLTPGDRLRFLRTQAGLNQKELSKKTGVGQSSISDFENNVKIMAADKLATIAKALNSTSEYIIFGGSNAKLVEDKQLAVWEDGDEIPANMVAIKYYDDVHVSAGYGYMNETPQAPKQLWFRRDSLDAYNVSIKDSEAVVVQGESMYPEFSDGQVIAVDRSATKIFDGEIYAFQVGEDTKVKFLFNWNEQGEGGFKAVSRNEDKVRFPDEFYSPARIESEGIYVIGQYWWKSQLKRIRR